MSDIPAALARQVIERAENRCEYCGLSQLGQEATFHFDHVMPRSANGPTVMDNLALACVSCSLRKGARQNGTDPETQLAVSLFNPRTLKWPEHFQWKDNRVVGLTPIGRATVVALDMNRPQILSIRDEEQKRGRFPPPRRE